MIEHHNKTEKTINELGKSYGELANTKEQFERQIRDIAKLMEDVNKKIKECLKDQERINESIGYYILDVNQTRAMNYYYTSLEDATKFKEALVAAGVGIDDIEIRLMRGILGEEIEDIDCHKRPEEHGYKFNPETIYEEYKCRKNHSKKRKVENE